MLAGDKVIEEKAKQEKQREKVEKGKFTILKRVREV